MGMWNKKIFGVVLSAFACSLSQAAVLNFDEFDGKTGWGNRDAGETWTYRNVMEGVDMQLRMDDVSSNTQVQVSSLDGDFKVTVKGKAKYNPNATFTASFLDSESGEAVAVSFDFLVKDFDRNSSMVERMYMSGLSSYTVTDDSRLSIDVTDSGLWAQAISGEVREDNQKHWMGGTFKNIESFTFNWGFDELGNGNRTHQRGMVLGGKATLQESFGGGAVVSTAVPEPASLAMLALGGILITKRRGWRTRAA